MMSEASTDQQNAWEKSYQNRQNFVFYPNEELLRFVAKYIRKRTGFDSFEDQLTNLAELKMLDVGCGIGRHLVMGLEFGFEPYGFDLSVEAVSKARTWLKKRGLPKPENHVVPADIRSLPWPDKHFDFAVSHGVLDSMPYDIASAGIPEVARLLKGGSYFYCDLIGGDNHEEVVTTDHEKDTVQSYFDETKIDQLFSEHFDIVEKVRVDRHNVTARNTYTRWHIALRKR